MRAGVAYFIVILAGTVSALSQDREAESSVHAWFAQRYGQSLLKEDPIGTSAYVIRPRATRLRVTGPDREIFGYLPYWFRGRWNQLDYDLLSTIAYFSGEVAADGSVGNTHGWPKYPGDPAASADVINAINAAHDHGVRVVLCFTNFEAEAVRALVSSPDSRGRFVREALSIVSGGGGDGINIDFERIPSVSRDSLRLFMQVLADSFHKQMPGSQVSCAPTDYDTRQGDWDLTALQPVVDLFFFQGYGYHYSGSSTSGPVGLLPNSSFWGATNSTTLIAYVLSRISPDRALLGLPHFGYQWPTTGPEPKSPTAGSGVAIYYPDGLSMIATYGRQWDVAGLSPWYRYQSGIQWYQGWYEDPESMSFKYQFALSQDLMGVGIWALGQDGSNHDLWDVLAAYFRRSSSVAEAGNTPGPIRLWQNYPNPFNGSTQIRYDIEEGGRGAGAIQARIAVHDVLGQEVALLVSEPRTPGSYSVRFEAGTLASGVYLYRMTAGGFTQTRKLVIVR